MRYSRQQINKLYFKKCFFCEERDYAALAAHRIIHGKDGGKYQNHNILICCANCHNKIHSGSIVIDRKYNSTKGIVVHYWKDGEEFWQKEDTNWNDPTSC